LVLLPDTFEGGISPAITTGTPEEKAKIREAFFSESGAGYTPKVIKQINGAGRAIGTAYPSVEKIGALGLCAGGKVRTFFVRLIDTPPQSWFLPPHVFPEKAPVQAH